ncbi:helix-turn-helix domain-containing protein [Tenacibaculum sp.]|nr:helix-turn-helix domain-containing protein [Tenacibaculum sp.]
MIYTAGISIALFITALLLNKKDKSKSDIILLLWMILIAVHLYLFKIHNTKEVYDMPYLLGISLPFRLLHSVFLFYYVTAVTHQFPKKSHVVFLHLLPTLASYIYLISFFYLPAEQKILIFEQNGKGFEVFNTIGSVMSILLGGLYVVWSSILLRRHKRNVQNQFSDIEEINLHWLSFLIYSLSLIWIVVIFTNNAPYIFMTLSVFVILVGFYGVQQRNIFSNTMPISVKALQVNKEPIKEEKKDKYATSGLRKEMEDDLYKKLLHLFVKETYYKKTNLSINDLATKLKVHPNYLSQIINTKENKSFYEFVNAFRIEEFKKLIKRPENKKFTFLALAYECGFNSKASFNRYFKKNTGQTPSQYFKSIGE